MTYTPGGVYPYSPNTSTIIPLEVPHMPISMLIIKLILVLPLQVYQALLFSQ